MKNLIFKFNLQAKAVLGAFLLLIIQCHAPEKEQTIVSQSTFSEAKGLHFAVNRTSIDYSILSNFLEAQSAQGGSSSIDYPVCVSTEEGDSDSLLENLLSGILTDAMNRWNDAIQNQPGWSITNITPYRVGGRSYSSCPRTDSGLEVLKIKLHNNLDGFLFSK